MHHKLKFKNINLFNLVALLTTSIFLTVSCTDSNDFGDIPRIEFLNVSKDSLAQGALGQDSTIIAFHFEDGGNNLGGDSANCFIRILRFGDRDLGIDQVESFKIPSLRQLSENGVEGEIFITWRSTCCTYPNGIPNNCSVSNRFPTQEIALEIYIEDEDGNRSNAITTSPLILICDGSR